MCQSFFKNALATCDSTPLLNIVRAWPPPVLIAQRLFQYFEDIKGNDIADIT